MGWGFTGDPPPESIGFHAPSTTNPPSESISALPIVPRASSSHA
uniref:Uncharacterized protein n=1 Tax=Arundo donax TaxID=35708 RepID=A0A0A8ZB25_ARUDO